MVSRALSVLLLLSAGWTGVDTAASAATAGTPAPSTAAVGGGDLASATPPPALVVEASIAPDSSVAMGRDTQDRGRSLQGGGDSSGSRRRPNVVILLADDLGFNELGYMNASKGLLTPEIDRLAAGGSTLMQYYAVPLCSPSRASMLTGA